MSIKFNCARCGKSYSVKEEFAGRKARCKCGNDLFIPQSTPDVEEEDIFALKEEAAPMTRQLAAEEKLVTPAPYVPTAAVATAQAAKLDSAGTEKQSGGLAMVQRFGYLLLLVALVPLAWSTFSPDHFSAEQALRQTIRHHPEVREKLRAMVASKTASDATLFDILPDHKFEGAWLPHDTYQHWLYALLSSAIFTVLILFIFPHATDSIGKMIGVGLFTATIGIMLLLAFQWVAEFTQHYWMSGGSILVVLFYIVKFIGFSYRAALNPQNGFIFSALGFTFGVGLCEEICKAAPVLLHYQTRGTWPWRKACLVGLISGIGFGVSEGITYSSDFYNGVVDGRMYLVRFISCVALHAVWAGSAAIFIYRHRDLLQRSTNLWGTLATWIMMISAPMVLHGMYDTLLKKQMDGWALGAALVSFAWFAWLVERARHDFDGLDAQSPQKAPRFSMAV